MTRKIFKGLVALLASFSLTAVARAQIVPVEYSGAATSTVAVQVPPFRGFEPSISIAYTSTRGNGFAGVGWALGAGSSIQRASRGSGAPRYDNTDIFLLDGDELIPCTTLGGTHCTRIQSFRRIAYTASTDSWRVTERDGSFSEFKPNLVVAANGATHVFRYDLSARVDLRGNRVDYGYWCDPGKECYLDTIRYGGNEIRFLREPRPDRISYANGAGLFEMGFRLRTIDVRAGANASASSPKLRARAYSLIYDTGFSSRSRLTEIREYGRDAVINETLGAITGGSALPPISLTYTPPATGYSAYVKGDDRLSSNASSGDVFLDANGDGRTDVVSVRRPSPGQLSFTTFSPDATGAYRQAWSSGTVNDAFVGNWFGGDLNRDGRSDLIGIAADSSVRTMLAASGGSFVAGPGTVLAGSPPPFNETRFQRTASFNDDGRTDLVQVGGVLGTGQVTIRSYVYSADGAYTVRSNQTFPVGINSSSNWFDGDINGDGRTDLVQFIISTSTVSIQSFIATASGYELVSPGQSIAIGYTGQRILPGDINGDGAMDFTVLGRLDSSTSVFAAFYSTGAGFAAGAISSYADPSPGTAGDFLAGDVDGDGRSDILRIVPGSSGAVAEDFGSTGAGYVKRGTYQLSLGLTAFDPALVDANGDGKSDLYALDGLNGQVNPFTALSPYSQSDLLQGLTTSSGGVFTVAYQPSAQWPAATYMPPGSVFPTVASLAVSDGRGTSTTHTLTYRGAQFFPEERRFLGFRAVTMSLDSRGTYRETFFAQREASISRPEHVWVRNSAGAIYNYQKMEYTENNAAPYTSFLTSQWGFECDLQPSCRTSLTQFYFDVYGNLLQSVAHGDYYVVGDERTRSRAYFPNLSTYSVGLTAAENLYAGVLPSPGLYDPTNPAQPGLMSQTLNFYDNAIAATTPPSVGNITETRYWDSNTGGYRKSFATYDTAGNRLTVKDARNNVTTFTPDPVFRVFPISVCSAVGHCGTTVWDTVLGVPTESRDPNSQLSTTQYDVFARPVTRVRPDGGRTTIRYLNLGTPASQRVETTLDDGTASGFTTTVYFDGLGRTWREFRDAVGGIDQRNTSYLDCSARQPSQVSLWRRQGTPAVFNRFEYDGVGRLTRALQPDGTAASTVYTPGRAARTDQLGHQTIATADIYGRVSSTQKVLDGGVLSTTTYNYDQLDRLVTMVDPIGQVSGVAWDSLSQRRIMLDPTVGRYDLTYDAVGNLQSTIDSRGLVIARAYDNDNRLTTVTTSDGIVEQYSYDDPNAGSSRGRITGLVVSEGATVTLGRLVHYDAVGRVNASTECILDSCASMNFAFDTLDRPTSVTYPSGVIVNYQYGEDARLSNVPGFASGFQYDAGGRLKQYTAANGVVTTRTFDPVHTWLTQTLVVGPTALPIFEQALVRDAAGRLDRMSSATDSVDNLDLTYDAGDRLIATVPLLGLPGGQVSAFTYDAKGSLLTRTENGASYTYGYGDPARKDLVTALNINGAGRAYTYDSVGNPLFAGTSAMKWDARGNLRQNIHAGGIENYTYDPSGQRIASDTTRFFGAFIERDSSGDTEFIYAGGMRIAKHQSGVVQWYHNDGVGSVRVVTDASGNVVARRASSPFGTPISTSGQATQWGWAGHRDEEPSGLIYMGARYYDPTLARFVSPDSIVPGVLPEASNRYAYALNDPIGKADPTGHSAFDFSLGTINFGGVLGGFSVGEPFLGSLDGGVTYSFSDAAVLAGLPKLDSSNANYDKVIAAAIDKGLVVPSDPVGGSSLGAVEEVIMGSAPGQIAETAGLTDPSVDGINVVAAGSVWSPASGGKQTTTRTLEYRGSVTCCVDENVDSRAPWLGGIEWSLPGLNGQRSGYLVGIPGQEYHVFECINCLREIAGSTATVTLPQGNAGVPGKVEVRFTDLSEAAFEGVVGVSSGGPQAETTFKVPNSGVAPTPDPLLIILEVGGDSSRGYSTFQNPDDPNSAYRVDYDTDTLNRVFIPGGGLIPRTIYEPYQ
ncbi:MAG: hypothetical protein JNN30_01800 [Rhodanobacteraceae bacterium]|nr:hypothetical protein [Rhodanobacteraceae bacterium]